MSQHGLYQPKIADEHIRQLYQWAKRLTDAHGTRLGQCAPRPCIDTLEQGGRET